MATNLPDDWIRKAEIKLKELICESAGADYAA